MELQSPYLLWSREQHTALSHQKFSGTTIQVKLKHIPYISPQLHLLAIGANPYPAPDGHSFLQINGADVNWEPISNGNTVHKYSIIYID